MAEIHAAPWLHIYAQFDQHDDAEIRGTGEGLKSLRDAIDRALATGEGKAPAITNDGEGYGVAIRRVNLVGLLGPLPYSQEPWPCVRHEEWGKPPSNWDYDPPPPASAGQKEE